MTIDGFLSLDRLPTAEELISLCGALEIELKAKDGAHVLRVNERNKKEGLLLSKIIKREPWRSQVIRRIEPPKELPPMECLWPGTGYIGEKVDESWPAGAYFWRYVGAEAWIPVPGRHWDVEKMRGTI